MDRFSKSCRLHPLPGLPTALQTAEALVTHVFRHYGVPEDIVSDRGPQFTSRICKVFMERLGVAICLTLRESTRMWAGFCCPIARTGQGSGQRSCPGQRWPRTRSATPPLISLPSSVYWGISRFWLLGIRVRLRLLRWTTGSGARRRHQRAVLRQKVGADLHRSEATVFAPGGPGLALDPKPAPPPALPEAGSAVCGAI